MKTTINLDRRDWGKVMIALNGALGRAYKIRDDGGGIASEMEIASLARIRASIKSQRGVARNPLVPSPQAAGTE